MGITKNTILIIVLSIIAVLLLYFYSGVLVDSVVKGKMNLNDWPGINNFGWVPALLTFGLGILFGWLIFRKKA
jgi:hypothetical protein